MKILLFTLALEAGGAERVITLLADQLASRGHDVALLTLSETATDFFPVVPQVRRIGLGLTKSPVGIAKLVVNLKRVRAIRFVLMREQPQSIISFQSVANVLAVCASFGLKIPVIASERVDPTAHNIGLLRSLLRRIFYPFATRLVVQTRSVAQWACAVVPGLPVVVIPNPVNRPPFCPQRRPSGTPINIVGMGRMEKQKGFDLLLRAVKTVNARGMNLSLTLYGDGLERANLEALSKSLDISHCVVFAGRTKEPSAALAAADIFVLSSRFEGFPNVLLEAMAVGVAVIAFDCPSGPGEIIEDGVSGLLVPNGDVDRLSEAIIQVASDAALRSALASGALARATAFDPAKIVEQWESLLTEAVRSK